MTVVEAVARAIYESEYADGFDYLDPEGIEYALQLQKARDAIEALAANATDVMALAACEAMVPAEDGESFCVTKETVAAGVRAAILQTPEVE